MTDRTGQVWEVGDRLYLVVSVLEERPARVVYNVLILDGDSSPSSLGNMRTLVEHGEGQWERISMQKRVF